MFFGYLWQILFPSLNVCKVPVAMGRSRGPGVYVWRCTWRVPGVAGSKWSMDTLGS